MLFIESQSRSIEDLAVKKWRSKADREYYVAENLSIQAHDVLLFKAVLRHLAKDSGFQPRLW